LALVDSVQLRRPVLLLEEEDVDSEDDEDELVASLLLLEDEEDTELSSLELEEALDAIDVLFSSIEVGGGAKLCFPNVSP